jgi:DEAD/DEAH box helicase domain-containing protein
MENSTQPTGLAGRNSDPRTEIYLDVETLRLSHEVPGGWSNIRQFGLALAVTWDAQRRFRHWFEEEAGQLVSELGRFSRVITFNGDRFDFEVLRAYASVEQLQTKSFDLLADLKRRLGHRVKLDNLASQTLGSTKSGSGLDAVAWWRAGDKDKVVEYCEKDVQLLIDLVAFARKNGYIVIGSQRVSVDWH